MQIREFYSAYPNYKKGMQTKTMALLGLPMEPVRISGAVFQLFQILYKYYYPLVDLLEDGRSHCLEMQVNGKTVNVCLKLHRGHVVGFCVETLERIAFSPCNSLSVIHLCGDRNREKGILKY